jgi:hypothetical protein
MSRVDKLDIADEMLDAAINEFLAHQRYIVAINLAAVAEELYGKYIRITGIVDTQRETINAVVRMTNNPDMKVKDWKNIANNLKNSIKHFDSESDRYIELNAEDEARFMIADALSNRDKLYRPDSPEVIHFCNYARDSAINIEYRHSEHTKTE